MSKFFSEVRVVGMHYRELEGVPAKSIVSNMLPDTDLTLVREPENPFDEFALKVFYQDQHIGYVEGKNACFISPFIDVGWTVGRCQAVDFVEVKNNLHPMLEIELDEPA